MKRALAFIVLGLLVIVATIAGATAAWLKVAVAKLDVTGAREPQAQPRNREQKRRQFDGCEMAVGTPPCQVRHPAAEAAAEIEQLEPALLWKQARRLAKNSSVG